MTEGLGTELMRDLDTQAWGPVSENEPALKSRGSPDLPNLPQHFQRPHPETWHLHQPREAWLPVC